VLNAARENRCLAKKKKNRKKTPQKKTIKENSQNKMQLFGKAKKKKVFFLL